MLGNLAGLRRSWRQKAKTLEPLLTGLTKLASGLQYFGAIGKAVEFLGVDQGLAVLALQGSEVEFLTASAALADEFRGKSGHLSILPGWLRGSTGGCLEWSEDEEFHARSDAPGENHPDDEKRKIERRFQSGPLLPEKRKRRRDDEPEELPEEWGLRVLSSVGRRQIRSGAHAENDGTG